MISFLLLNSLFEGFFELMLRKAGNPPKNRQKNAKGLFSPKTLCSVARNPFTRSLLDGNYPYRTRRNPIRIGRCIRNVRAQIHHHI